MSEHLRLSNAKVKTYRRCPKAFDFKYEQGLRPKKKALPLERGTWIHELLQHHYDGEPWQEAHKRLTSGFNNLFDEEKEEFGDLPSECERIMRAYLRHWKKEDEGWRVIDSELNEILKVNDDLSFEIVVDLIVEEHDGLWIVDHKTVKSFMDVDFQLLDAQLARYFWGIQKMGYTPLRGILFNEIRTKPPAIPEVLQSGSLTRRKNIDTDLWTYRRAIREVGGDEADYGDILLLLAKRGDAFFRRRRFPKDRPLTKRLMRELAWSAREIRAAQARQEFPRAPDKSCSWCEYRDPCIVQLHGGDISSMLKANYETRQRGN